MTSSSAGMKSLYLYVNILEKMKAPLNLEVRSGSIGLGLHGTLEQLSQRPAQLFKCPFIERDKRGGSS